MWSFPKLRILKYLLAAFLGAWTPFYSWAFEQLVKQGEDSPWYLLAIVDVKYSAPILFAVALALLSIYEDWNAHSFSIRLQMQKFLQHLHKKHLPHPHGERDPESRVTLFAPGAIRRWSLKIIARSGTSPKRWRVRWKIRRSEAGKYHGVTGHAWATELFVAFDNLPDYDAGSPEEKLEYLQKTFITADEIKKVNWKARSYRALTVKNLEGKKVGVLMMESKRPNGLLEITPEKLRAEAENLQFLLG